MRYQQGDRVRIVQIDYGHLNRTLLIGRGLIGFTGTVTRASSDKGGYYVYVDQLQQTLLLYDDELELMDD